MIFPLEEIIQRSGACAVGLKPFNDGTIGRKTPREDGRLTNELDALQVALAKGGDEGGLRMGPCSSRSPVALVLFIFFFNYVVMNSIAAFPLPMELHKT